MMSHVTKWSVFQTWVTYLLDEVSDLLLYVTKFWKTYHLHTNEPKVRISATGSMYP